MKGQLENKEDCAGPQNSFAAAQAPSTASPARTALPTAHFDRNKIHAIRGQDTRVYSQFLEGSMVTTA